MRLRTGSNATTESFRMGILYIVWGMDKSVIRLESGFNLRSRLFILCGGCKDGFRLTA
jgi:hypothetical protein